jgi:hypothetical protein
MVKGRWSVIHPSLLALLLLSPAQEQLDEGFLLTKGRAGQVRIGMSVGELYAKIGRSHTKLVDLFKEGFFDPALEIYLDDHKNGHPSLVAEIGSREGCHSIWRIRVTDPRFKTPEEIGVGSTTLGGIRKNYHVDWIDFCEGSLCARVNQIGMSFALDCWPPASWRKRSADIPNSAKVVSVLVVE